MLDRTPVGSKKVEKKEPKNKYEQVSQMIRDALAQGDLALATGGKAPQSGMLANPQLQQRYGNGLQQSGVVYPMGATSGTVKAPKSKSNKGTGAVNHTGNPDRDYIIDKESDGLPYADNPNSTAFGIGQLIEKNRKAYAQKFGFHPDTVNPQEQLQMMDAYVMDRYGSYANARRFHEQHGWY